MSATQTQLTGEITKEMVIAAAYLIEAAGGENCMWSTAIETALEILKFRDCDVASKGFPKSHLTGDVNL